MVYQKMLRASQVLILALFTAQITVAQEVSTIDPGAFPRPSATAVRLDSDPVLDGNVLSDEAWSSVPVIDSFVQTRPSLGSPSSENTEVRIGFTDEMLWVGVICYDSEPGRLVVSDARRDASLENTDSFQFIVDTFHDGQNGFVFGTNPLGVEYDAQIDNEGQGNFSNNRQQAGRIGGVNVNWDASWDVRASVTETGWSAEFAIPLRTLRFKPGTDRTWGLNFQRNIRKNNEVAFWAPMPIVFNLYRLSMAGTLSGLDLESPGNLKIIPYALGEIVQDRQSTEDETVFSADAGLDVKYSVTSSLTLDLSYNTDFAQVEVDEQQINLDRFNLFFPEKRPFFLENAGLFSVGSPGEVEMFFTRRIGIGNGGQQVPILGGARLSGRVNKTNVGLLSMFTDSVTDAQVQANNFSVARVNHEFEGRSAIGAAFINRQGMGDLSGEDDFNRTFAIDGKLGLGQKAQLSGFFARTETPGIEVGETAFKVQSRYEWEGLLLNAAFTQVGEGFNPEVGFLQRSSFRKPEGLIFWTYRPDWIPGMLEMRPHITYRGYWSLDGLHETNYVHVDNHWVWETGMEIHTAVNFTLEGVKEDFEIFPGIEVPAETYRHKEAQIVFSTNASNPVSVNVYTLFGGFFGGDRRTLAPTLSVRLGDAFSSSFSFSRNDISLPGGDFTTNLFQTKLSYSFTPRLFLQGLAQYNDRIDAFSANIRLGWLQQANTGLFLVFNENRMTDDFADGLVNRSVILKYSRLFDVVR